MSKKRVILRNIAIFFLSLLIYLVIATTFSYFEIVSYKVINVISFIFLLMLFMYSGFYLAKRSDSKGYINGLLIGGINICLLFLISLILKCNIELNIILYFLILLLSSTMGGMFGINFNNKLDELKE